MHKPHANHAQEPLKNTAEVSAFLGISKSALEKGRAAGNEGLPPYIRIGKSTVRYRMKDVIAWLDTSIME